MDATMYRRRVSGRGSRVAGKRRNEVISHREKRRLLQLAASLVLFLLVFVGRGVFPRQMAALSEAINSDMDLEGVLSAFAPDSAENEEGETALDRLIAAIVGEMKEDGNDAESQTPQSSVILPELPSFLERMNAPGIAEIIAAEEATPVPSQEPEVSSAPAESEPPAEEPVVTAVAQLYSPSGEALPERVSYEYYNLGLEEMVVPVMGNISSGFGFRDHPVYGEYTFHTAVDVAVDTGTEILAFSGGTVRYIGESDVFGLYLKIDHDNGVSTFYAHCDELLVKKGERVIAGQVVALSGETGNATGPHLHFSLEKDGIRLDPEYYLEFDQ